MFDGLHLLGVQLSRGGFGDIHLAFGNALVDGRDLVLHGSAARLHCHVRALAVDNVQLRFVQVTNVQVIL